MTANILEAQLQRHLFLQNSFFCHLPSTVFIGILEGCGEEVRSQSLGTTSRLTRLERMDRGQMMRGLRLVPRRWSCWETGGGPGHDKECCRCADVTLVQVGYSQHGDLELVGIRDGIRRRKGISRKFQSRARLWDKQKSDSVRLGDLLEPKLLPQGKSTVLRSTYTLWCCWIGTFLLIGDKFPFKHEVVH